MRERALTAGRVGLAGPSHCPRESLLAFVRRANDDDDAGQEASDIDLAGRPGAQTGLLSAG